jgi:2-polyprenyl-6-methoxyphenol hydroxylase-like FAD-dependent oxidoreductase
MTSRQKITIVGAGLGGLTLARSLKNSGIKTIIFEKNPSPAHHSYGITLQPWACQTLLRILGIDESTFCQRVAVDSANGGRGYVYEKFAVSAGTHTLPTPLRAHCGRLEGLLRENLDIKWGHALESISKSDSGQSLVFKNEEKAQSEFTIDTSGVHSQIRRSLLPKKRLNILPYVVFRGTRKIPGWEFVSNYEPHFKAANIITTKKKDIILQIQINDFHKNPDAVEISYIYSRPAYEDDKLHRPERQQKEAVNVSEAFFGEVAELGDLEAPFQATFSAEKMKDERILHWLMRDIVVPLDELVGLADQGIVLLGDSAHAIPILGGEGANLAISDAVELADVLVTEGSGGVGDYYRRKHHSWEAARKLGEEKLADMHAPLLFLKSSIS